MSTGGTRIFILMLALSAFAETAVGSSPSVTAVLSNSETAVGDTVQMQIKVTGQRGAEAPERIAVDGLEIYRTGTEQHVELNNLNFSQSVIYTYTILAQKSGTFKIPPQTIRVGSSSLRTPELTLTVVDSPNRSARSAPGTQATANKIASAELIVTKKNAYVGEMVPVEIRLRFDSRARPQLQEPPTITGQGFTSQKLTEPQQNFETIDSVTYNVVTFKTAIAAARVGKFEIGPVEAKAQVSVPQRRTSPRSRSPFDLFNLDDPFSDPFFNDPLGRFGQRTIISIKSEAVALDVKPLPPNAPRTFSGAVGNFTMTTDANPKSLQVGDPITVTSTISGRGNFDRMNAPSLEDERGWHKYPPSSKFNKDDDVGISGAKTFEMVVSPNEKKQALPPLVFSYFNPVKENYMTLRSDAFPLHVEGGSVTPAPTPIGSAPAPATPAKVAAKPSPKPPDILYQLTERGPAQSFRPVYARRTFWFAQIAPLVALLGLVGWKIRQAKIDNREAQRIAALQQEATVLLHRLRRSELSPQQYFSDASRAVRVKTALAKNVDPNAVDAEIAAAAFVLDDRSREQLRRLFERSDELRYSGRPNGAGTTSREDRQEVLQLIERLHT